MQIKPEYYVPVLITLSITAIAGYVFYKKYAPTIGAVNAGNDLLGFGEKAFVGAEDFLLSLFPALNGNEWQATSNLL